MKRPHELQIDLKKAIDAEIERASAPVLTGVYKTLDEYRFAVGMLAGLKAASAAVEQYFKRADQDEDD